MRKTLLLAGSTVLLGAAVAAASLGVAISTAPPASAHAGHGVFVQWQSPADGQRLSGSAVRIKAKMAFGDDGVKSWKVEVLAPPEARPSYPGFGTLCEEAVGGAPSYVNIDCPWDTTAYSHDGGLSRNREYIVRITGVNAERGILAPPSEAHRDERRVMVVNPVSAPRDVRLSFSDASRQASVRWVSNPEPDIVSYAIQERVGQGGWQTVGKSAGQVTSFNRNLSAPGTYRYQVAALRSAGTGSDTLQSAWSGPSVEPTEIVVSEPPRPASSTTPPSGGPSGEGAAQGGDPGGAPPPGGEPADPALSAPVPPGAAPGAPEGAVPAGAASAGAAPAGGAPDSARGAPAFTPIERGAPGSVASRGTSSGRLVAPPTPKATEPPQAPDTGFSQALPYPKKAPAGAAEDGTDDIARVVVGLPEAVSGDARRELIVPLAGGLLLFVFAAHAFCASRRGAGEQLEID